MKTLSFLHSPLAILLSVVLFTSCGHSKSPEYTVSLTFPDGTTETHIMMKGSMLLINQGDQHLVAKAIDGTNNTLVWQVARYGTTRDTLKRELTLKKMEATTTNLTMSKSTTVDPTGGVQVQLQSMAMIDPGKQPKGPCGGICCEATCFTVSCCGDVFECKNAPCNCKGPANCPGQDTNPQPSRFFDLYKSGNDVLVLKD